jgi:hypothetical protein
MILAASALVWALLVCPTPGNCLPAARAAMTGSVCMKAAKFLKQEYPQYSFKCEKAK